MQRWTELEQVPDDLGPTVVTIGTFDGVHRGHQAVLEAAVHAARAGSFRAVALTFDPHPATVHRPEVAPPLLTGLVDRLELLEAVGLDGVLVQHYTAEFAATSAEDFVRTWFVEGLGARRVVVGHDVRFGAGNEGDLATLVELGGRYGFEVQAVDDAGSERRWSSTWVRELLAQGDVPAAAAVLGRLPRLRGEVVRGDGRGRDLGFPTANLGADLTGLVPTDGVYAGWMTRPALAAGDPDRLLPVAVSIGTNPTFDGVARRVEANVPGRTDLDLYGEQVVLEIAHRLRDTERFESVEALIDQMHEDVSRLPATLADSPFGPTVVR